MYTETPDIIPFTSPIKGEVLTQSELKDLKGKTLHILNEIGVHFPSPKALDILPAMVHVWTSRNKLSASHQT